MLGVMDGRTPATGTSNRIRLETWDFANIVQETEAFLEYLEQLPAEESGAVDSEERRALTKDVLSAQDRAISHLLRLTSNSSSFRVEGSRGRPEDRDPSPRRVAGLKKLLDQLHSTEGATTFQERALSDRDLCRSQLDEFVAAVSRYKLFGWHEYQIPEARAVLHRLPATVDPAKMLRYQDYFWSGPASPLPPALLPRASPDEAAYQQSAEFRQFRNFLNTFGREGLSAVEQRFGWGSLTAGRNATLAGKLLAHPSAAEAGAPSSMAEHVEQEQQPEQERRPAGGSTSGGAEGGRGGGKGGRKTKTNSPPSESQVPFGPTTTSSTISLALSPLSRSFASSLVDSALHRALRRQISLLRKQRAATKTQLAEFARRSERFPKDLEQFLSERML